MSKIVKVSFVTRFMRHRLSKGLMLEMYVIEKETSLSKHLSLCLSLDISADKSIQFHASNFSFYIKVIY